MKRKNTVLVVAVLIALSHPNIAWASGTRQFIELISFTALFIVATIMVTHALCMWRHAKWPWFLSPIVFCLVAGLYIGAARLAMEAYWIMILIVTGLIYLFCDKIRKEHGNA